MEIFITGTDTEVGKTYISIGLLKKFNEANLSTVAFKPVASGCDIIDGEFRNQDALALQQAASIPLGYDKVNPFAFRGSTSPNIAANMERKKLSVIDIANKLKSATKTSVDITLIEGIGGWCVPINGYETMADVVKLLKIPVVLVIAIKLGCLNHALLTLKVMEQANISLVGWVANCLQAQENFVLENIQTLKSFISAPCLGVVPYGEKPENYLDISSLLLQCGIAR